MKAQASVVVCLVLFPALVGCQAGAPVPPSSSSGAELPSSAAPGAKPSEHPSASRWIDPPAASPNPCCEVGAHQGIDNPKSQGSMPYIARNAAGWAVAWGDFDGSQPLRAHIPTLRPVDPKGQPIGDLIAVPGPASRLAGGAPTAMAWHQDRYAIFTATRPSYRAPDRDSLVLLVDQNGALRGSTSVPRASYGGAITRFAAASAWAVATFDEIESDPTGSSRLFLFDDELRQLGRDVDLGRTLDADWRAIEVISVGDRLVTVQATDIGIRVRTFVGRTLNEAPGLSVVVPLGNSVDPSVPRDRSGAPIGPTESPIWAIGAGRLRDSVVISAMDRQRVRTWVFDPFTGVLSGGSAVANGTGYRTHGVSGDDIGGTAGICFTDGPDPRRDADSLRFALVGPDGKPLGEPVTVASGLRYVAACAVSAGGQDEYLVALWNASKNLDEVRPSILIARVQVRREQTIEAP